MNIGFVGLGAMGAGIVPRLMAAGHAVTGWNRSKQKAEALIAAGMRLAETPRAAAATCDVVFSIVTDAAAVRAVALGGDGIIAGLKKGGIYVDMSTIAPDASRAISAEFAKQGVTMLDAPISGSPVTLAQGNAAVMVGGDKAAFERIEPVLRAIGPKVTYIGASGLAVQMKIAVNLLLMVEVIAFGEAVALAEKAGWRARLRSTRSSRASPPRRCWPIAGRSSWTGRCPPSRSPTSRCNRRTCCWRSSSAASSAARCRWRRPPTK